MRACHFTPLDVVKGVSQEDTDQNMLRSIAKFVLVTTASVMSLQAPALADPVPIEDLARLPAISSVTVSTDGETMYALIGPSTGNDQDRAVIAAWDLNDLSKPPVTAAPDGKDSEFFLLRALKNKHVLTYVRQPYTGVLRGCSEGKMTGSTRTWVNKILITDNTFSKFDEPFLELDSGKGVSKSTEICLGMEARGSVVSRLPLDPDSVIISRLDARSFENELVRYNLETGESESLFKNTSDRSAGYIDPRDGEVMSASGTDDEGGKYTLRTWLKPQKGGDLELQDELSVDLVKRQELDIIHWDQDNNRYFVLTNKFSDKKRIYAYDPATHKFSEEPLFAHPDFDAAGVYTSQNASRFGRVLGFIYDADVSKIQWVDPEVGGLMLGLEKSFAGQHVSLIYISDDLNRVVFSTESSNEAPRYFLLQDKSKLQMIGAERPWIDTNSIGSGELVQYTARDGLTLPAILTPRAGWKPGDAPGKAVVLPHGGPWARDFGGWDASGWVPFLTSRGYTVLQPQYRGSTGWGLDLWRAGDGQFGYKAQDDDDDGAAWLVSEGYANPDQIVMFGYSYGGYAAMAATTRANSPYRCAIAGAGYAESAKINVKLDRNRFGRMVYADALSGRDVIKDVANAEIPVLIFHGDRDVRVPNKFGKAFYNAVKRYTTAKYVSIPDMPHSLPWTPAQQRKSLGAIDSFLQNECGLE